MVDEMARRAREAIDVPWDDLREARVLQRTLAGARTPPRPQPRHALWLGAALGVAAAVALVLLWPARPQPLTAEPSLAFDAVAPSDVSEGSALTLADGSVARLAAGGDVKVRRDTPEDIELSQEAGQVRYQVVPATDRTFRVDAAGVQITVVVAVFTVSVDGEQVEVQVDDGRVRVQRGSQTLELGAGEHIRVRASEAERTPAAADRVPEGPNTEAKVDPVPVPAAKKAAPRTSAATLMSRADEARGRGDAEDAKRALDELIARFPKDRRIPTALFTRGKVERRLGHHRAGAKSFEACWKRARRGPLAEDCLAESATSFAAAGDRDRARKAAERYVDRFPEGIHHGRMKKLAN